MKRLKLGLFFAAACAFLLTTTDTHALEAIDYAPPPNLDDSPVIITGYSITNARLDYVQLYNEEDRPISLDNWRLEYLMEGQSEPLVSIALSEWVAPTNYLLVADSLVVSNPDFMFTMADPNGSVPVKLRIVPAHGSEFTSHEINVSNGVRQRNISASTGAYLSTFSVATNPTLYGGGFYDFLIATNLQFSEIVAHPRKCSPLETTLDCVDYVKLYNPTTSPIDLSQFRLRVGYVGQNPSSSNTFILTGTLLPGEYVVVAQDFDNQSISLTNSGSFIWLEDTYGIIRYDNTVMEYPNAGADSKQGWAWAYDTGDGQWKWTSQPTPRNAPSVFVLPVETKKAAAQKSLVPCKEGQYRSEETNRCRSIASTASTLTPCKEGQERNPETNRCRLVAGVSTELKPCEPGQERNPDTNRCRKVTGGDIPGAAFAVQETPESGGSFVGWWALAGVGALAAGYGVWEWRRELWSGIRKIGTFFTSSK
jgi:hypothetical protein